MYSKKDTLFALLLIAIAAVCIIRFLVLPGRMKETGSDSTSQPVVSENISEVGGETNVDSTSETIVSEPEKEEISIPEVSLENPEVSHSVEIETSDDLEEIKAQLPHIRPNSTLADCDIVFIGDSIFEFGDEENDSIPDKVARTSEATVYSCSKAGIAAGTKTNQWISMPELASCFVKGENTDAEGCDIFNYSLNRYVERDHTDRQLIFILDCCINDYYQHTPLTNEKNSAKSFVGSYTKTLTTLKSAFPDAIVICMVPNDVRHEEYGYNFNGAGSTYNMYKDAIQCVANEFNVFCLRMDTEDGINRDKVAELLEDGTHPNVAGRELMTGIIIKYIQTILDSVNS